MRLAVVKNIVRTPGRVTGKTSRTVVRITIYPIVVIVRFRIGMAGRAGKFCIVRRIGMAVLAQIPRPLVLAAVYREIIGIVLTVFRRHPINIRRVAFGAILRKIGNRVIRIYCRFKIVFMTGNTIGWRTRIAAAGMAFGTIRNVVPFGQREKVVIHLIGRPVETGDIMALRTIGGKSGRLVVRVGGRRKIGQVAIDTIISDAVEL